MRCPSCGTDNALDSRFCGGCGTRFAVSGQRVAPTQKISDDASFPQRQAVQGAGSAVPITAPGVVAPRAVPAGQFLPPGAPPTPRPLAGGSAAPVRPPTAPATPQPARRHAVVVEDPALSLPIAARRPWALILVVLLIDLGLAAAGIWMLAHGLGDRPSARSGALVDPGATPPSRLGQQDPAIHRSAGRIARRTFPAGAPLIPPLVPAPPS